MTDRIPAPHAEHDPLLVAAFAAGDVGPAEREQAEHLASTCAECALLVSDLRAIATATAALPPRTRPREFALRAEDAARLRRRSWRGLVRAFGGPRSAALRPLATGLTTLGLAGLLLAALPAMQLGGSAAAPLGSVATQGGQAGDNPKAVDTESEPSIAGGPGRQYSAESAPPPALVPVTGPQASPDSVDLGAGNGAVKPEPTPARQPGIVGPAARAASPLVVVSGTFLILGLGLFGLRWTARRLGDG